MGGAIPPGQKWLNRLPVIDTNTLVEGFGVFTGTVNGVNNLLFSLSQENDQWNLLVYRNENNQGHWRFNVQTNEFEIDMTTGTNWQNGIIEQGGLEGVVVAAAAGALELVDKGEIGFRLNPAS